MFTDKCESEWYFPTELVLNRTVVEKEIPY